MADSKPIGRPFQKGVSGNPGGRPKKDNEVERLAKEHTEATILRLVHWMEPEDAERQFERFA